jgi:hypothetical protein
MNVHDMNIDMATVITAIEIIMNTAGIITATRGLQFGDIDTTPAGGVTGAAAGTSPTTLDTDPKNILATRLTLGYEDAIIKSQSR